VAELVEAMAPLELAQPWDNVGLLAGDPEAKPGWVAVALDAAHATWLPTPLEGPGLLVVHHPLPFRPAVRLTEDEPVGAVLASLIRGRISLYAAHTNFDSAPEGLSHLLAVRLGLSPESLRPLAPPPAGAFYKLVVFVPEEHLAAVRAALAEAGAGWIGNYSDTAFSAPGRGYFRPREGADPYLGRVGEVEEVGEERLETIVPAHRLSPVLRRMLEVHPYEEVAYDVYQLRSHPPVTRPELVFGLGRVGDLSGAHGEEASLEDFRASVERSLGLPPGGARLVAGRAGEGPGRAGSATVRRVAVCPGKGGDHVRAAAGAGADVFVTGELGYHEALDAAQLGLAVITAGHLATERMFVPEVAGRLRKALDHQGIPLRVIEVPTPSDWLV
jgi:dinuclear metal center YbgI/SA1388 family protein